MDLFRKKWFWGVLLGLAIIALVFVNMNGLNKAALVSTAEVTEGTLAEQVFTNGKLVPGETTAVFSPVNGVIKSMKVKLGDQVKKGQTLLALNMDDVKEQIEKEKINIQLTESERLTAKKQSFENFKKVHSENPDAVPEKLDLTSYDLRIRTSQITIASLEKQLSKQTVESPVGGVVTKVSANVGQALAQGTEVVTIVDMSTLKVKANLNEMDAGKVKVGMTTTITGDSFADKYSGKVTYMAPTAELATAAAKDPTVEITVTLDKVSSELRPGYNVTVEMVIPDKQRLLVPTEAVQYDGDQPFVYKVENGKAVKVKVKIGKEGDEQIELTSGVAKGDHLVTNGADKLQDGAKVKTE